MKIEIGRWNAQWFCFKDRDRIRCNNLTYNDINKIVQPILLYTDKIRKKYKMEIISTEPDEYEYEDIESDQYIVFKTKEQAQIFLDEIIMPQLVARKLISK